MYPGDSKWRFVIRDFFQVTNNQLKGHLLTTPKRSPAELPGMDRYGMYVCLSELENLEMSPTAATGGFRTPSSGGAGICSPFSQL